MITAPHAPPGTLPERQAGRLTIVEEHPAAPGGPRTVDAPGGEHAPARGPLVAVCGVCGGAGASTLAYLLARFEQRSLAGEVLVADTGGPGGGIAALAGVQAARSLTEIAELLQAGLPAGQPIASAADGLRVLATGPRFPTGTAPSRVRVLLEQARERYTLAVIDCGTLARDADQVALAAASHAIWLLPATRRGLDRARALLDAINPHAREILAARPEPDSKPPVRQLKHLAGDRGAPLVLLPVLPDLDNQRAITNAIDTWQVPLQAIHGLLHRPTHTP